MNHISLIIQLMVACIQNLYKYCNFFFIQLTLFVLIFHNSNGFICITLFINVL